MTGELRGHREMTQPSAKRQSQSQSQQQQQQPQLAQSSSTPRFLNAGFVHLTGGVDPSGRQVACFPPRNIIRMHLNNVGTSELVCLIEFYLTLATQDQRSKGFAFLADFRACSQSIFRIIIDSLDAVEKQNSGSVSVFYVLLPRSKELAKSLQKMLGLYEKKQLIPKKSSPKGTPRPFRSVIIPTLQELHQFINKANLMVEYGGKLNYDHEAWMKLRSAYDALLIEVGDIVEKVPDALENLERLKDFNRPEDNEECQDVAQGMQDHFQSVTANLGLDAAAEKVSQLKEACLQPEKHPDTMPLAGNPLLKPYADRLHRLEAKLEEMRLMLRQKWKDAESGLLTGGQMDVHRKSATALADWLDRSSQSARRIDTRAIVNQQMAEDAKEKFRMQVQEPSTAKVAECRSLIARLRQFANAAGPSSDASKDAANLADRFESKLRGFNDTIGQIGDRLEKINVFYSGCDKLVRWYRQCMLRLPFDLLIPEQSRLPTYDSLPMSAKWLESAKTFQQRHPRPTQEELDALGNSATTIDNSEVRREGELLVFRSNFLCHLLDRQINVGEFRDLLEWRDQETSPDAGVEFSNLRDPSQSVTESTSSLDEPSPQPVLVRAVRPEAIQRSANPAASIKFPPMADRDSASIANSDQRRYRRHQVVAAPAAVTVERRSRTSSTRSGTEIVEVIPQPIIIDHNRMPMAHPPPPQAPPMQPQPQPQQRNYPSRYQHPPEPDPDDYEDEEAGIWTPRRAVPTLESQPKEETVRRFLEKMVTPPASDETVAEDPPPMMLTLSGRSRSTSQSLSDLVSKLKGIGDVMFGGGTRAKQTAPVAARLNRRLQQQHQAPSQFQHHQNPQHQRLLSDGVSRSQSEQDLALMANHGRRRQLFLLQFEDPPGGAAATNTPPSVVAYPIEVGDFNRIIGDIREIAGGESQSHYKLQLRPPEQQRPLYRSREGAGDYSMSRMSDTDPVDFGREFADFPNSSGDGFGHLRPSRYSDNFLFGGTAANSLENQQRGGGGGGGSHSPRPLMSPPPPIIPEERVTTFGGPWDASRGGGGVGSSGSLGDGGGQRWRRRDNRIWQANSRYS